MISGYRISTTDIFSRRVVSMNASIYQVNRGKLHIAKNQNESYSPIFFYYSSFLSRLYFK